MIRSIEDRIGWIDIVNPQREDLQFLRENFNIHPIILEELIHPSMRTHVERAGGHYLFFVFHVPLFDYHEKSARRGEIDFIVTESHIITVRYESVVPLEELWHFIERRPYFKEKLLSRSTGMLLYYIVEALIEFSLRQLQHIEEKIESITKRLFKGEEIKLLREITYVKRDLINYNLISRPQEHILRSLERSGGEFWSGTMDIYLSDLLGDYLKVAQLSETHKESIEALETTNAQLLEAKTGTITKTLTILAFLALPMSLVVALFGMSINYLPLRDSPYAFPLVLGSITILGLITLLLFKIKKWI
ncbi:MAG: hypothetical protein A3A04_00110 [Candidatus Harrisonbacteria bacterium RIFCSPLOWO2_01_FULL_40_28]|uniref:Magnesium transporter CorA n=2 Tax=Candidatus Harrisoniibacteriota TaxID=1817905 RepID=A0A1G1ZXV2_9BACT|nr:MAG: hypothetical protein A3A04_00110 [Candidatus Harrisonbacteria bacterium RIFCSPLOWO2_01_FULL_40_28]OGY69382.1 MAG: hypothetical protein A2586_00165 [Candidatus Harrisonbacteria bacterium RIFOXYD1_FULL_40_9]